MADGALPPVASADWWVVWQSLYEEELQAFAAYGARTTVVVRAAGRLVLEVAWPWQRGVLPLRVGYSPLHPFFRPSVVATSLQLGRHQHRLDGGLCLLTQESGQWRSGQKVADLISEQLTKVLDANSARDDGRLDDAARVEENAPDPISSYYAHLALPDAAVFFAADQRTPPGNCGFAEFSVSRRTIGELPFLQAVLRKVEPASGAWLGKAFAMRLEGQATAVPGRWVRMEPPVTEDVDQILAAAEAAIETSTALQPGLQRRMRVAAEAKLAVTGLLFQEEVTYGPSGYGDGWLFIISQTDPETGQRHNALIRGYRMTDDLQARVPVAAALVDKKVLQIGAGAIGSFVALELARAGCAELRIFDFDVVEPGNSVRWPLGRPMWGVRKVVALKGFIEQHYPQVRVRACQDRVGAATTLEPPTAAADDHPLGSLRTFILDADVVVDASASTECMEAVAHLCRTLGKPLVVGYATEGAAGGVVARFPADAKACYSCLQAHWKDPEFPKPAVDPDGTMTPIGCNQPTFTGAAFDLQEVCLEIVRSAVGLMVPGTYDPGDWQIGVLSLIKEGRRCPPNWDVANLSPTCPGCART